MKVTKQDLWKSLNNGTQSLESDWTFLCVRRNVNWNSSFFAPRWWGQIGSHKKWNILIKAKNSYIPKNFNSPRFSHFTVLLRSIDFPLCHSHVIEWRAIFGHLHSSHAVDTSMCTIGHCANPRPITIMFPHHQLLTIFFWKKAAIYSRILDFDFKKSCFFPTGCEPNEAEYVLTELLLDETINTYHGWHFDGSSHASKKLLSFWGEIFG